MATPSTNADYEFIGDDLPDDVLDVLAGILIDAWEADQDGAEPPPR